MTEVPLWQNPATTPCHKRPLNLTLPLLTDFLSTFAPAGTKGWRRDCATVSRFVTARRRASRIALQPAEKVTAARLTCLDLGSKTLLVCNRYGMKSTSECVIRRSRIQKFSVRRHMCFLPRHHPTKGPARMVCRAPLWLSTRWGCFVVRVSLDTLCTLSDTRPRQATNYLSLTCLHFTQQATNSRNSRPLATAIPGSYFQSLHRGILLRSL